MHSESSSCFKLFRVLFVKIFLRWRSLHLPHSFQLSRPAPPSFLSLPDRYEQMFTPQLRSRYWLRRRRRRNDKSFRKWRRACDTRVERGRLSIRRSQLPFLSLTRHSPGRDATKRRYKCAQLITIRVKYLCDSTVSRASTERSFRHPAHDLDIIVSHSSQAKQIDVGTSSCLIAVALLPIQSIYATAKYTDRHVLWYIPFQ